jgi:hypothetical protein
VSSRATPRARLPATVDEPTSVAWKGERVKIESLGISNSGALALGPTIETITV